MLDFRIDLATGQTKRTTNECKGTSELLGICLCPKNLTSAKVLVRMQHPCIPMFISQNYMHRYVSSTNISKPNGTS